MAKNEYSISMLNKIIAKILYFLLRVLKFTYRFHFIDATNKEKAKSLGPNRTYIFAIWHQNLVGGILAHSNPGDKFTMIISESKDGELVAVTCEQFGHEPARGSSTRGGPKALVEMVKKLKKGIPGALTVDGPKGPKYQVKFGVIEMAKLAECPIVPYNAYATKFWTFEKSWDQFRFPKPFSTIYVVIGDPIVVPKDLPQERYPEFSKYIADRIHDTERYAIRLCTNKEA